MTVQEVLVVSADSIQGDEVELRPEMGIEEEWGAGQRTR